LANSAAPLITTIQIADSSYNVLDDTAANTTGGFVVITGSGFTNSSTVVFGSTAAPAVSFISSTTLRAQVPALTAASYPVYVVNTNGGTGIRINGLTTSSFPAWSTGATLANTTTGTAFSVALSANSDSSITYSNTTSLPAGTTLAANGLFSGAVSVGADTTFTFTVKATDVQLQDANRTFSVTITLPVRRLWGTGRNNVGQLGRGNATDSFTIAQLGTATDWTEISSGFTTMAIKTDGTLWSAGGGRSSPVQINASTTWSQVSAQDSGFYFGVKTDGTLWSWGTNADGQLGHNDTTTRGAPTQVGVLTNWAQARAGVRHMLARKTDGTLWCCGFNYNGELGLSIPAGFTTGLRSSPTQIGSNTNWNKIAVGGDGNSMATKTDGTLWTWGQGLIGALGLNSTAYRSSPTQVAGNNWNDIDSGSRASIATKTDGTLWTWGTGGNGASGTNTTAYRSSPQQVGAGTNWSLVSMGTSHAGAIKTDGTLWLWGRGNYGQVGDGVGINRSSPVQVGAGQNFVAISAKGGTTFAIALG